jgi:hypothetical protein
MPRFHFHVPVLSKVMTSRWLERDYPDGRCVETSLRQCLNSLLNQSERDIQINVCAHEFPPLPDDPRIVKVQADFPRPPDIDLDTYNKLSGKILEKLPGGDRRKINDKYSKLKKNLANALGDEDCEFSMFVDHDDMVHRDVVKTVFERADEEGTRGGFTITQGYWHDRRTGHFGTMGGFHKTCGTCNIVRLELWEKRKFAEDGSVNYLQDRKEHWLFAGHASVFARLRKAGRSTKKLGFPAAVYVVATGSNFSGSGGRGRGNVKVTPEFLAQFGMTEDEFTEMEGKSLHT